MKTRNQTYVDVLAHTDTSGTPQGNQALSDKRAAAVATYLAGHGVAKARIASKGLGESRAALQSGDRRNAKGRQPPHRDPAGALPRLAPLGEKAPQQLAGLGLADAAEHVGPVMAGRLGEYARAVNDAAALRVLGARSAAP